MYVGIQYMGNCSGKNNIIYKFIRKLILCSLPYYVPCQVLCSLSIPLLPEWNTLVFD